MSRSRITANSSGSTFTVKNTTARAVRVPAIVEAVSGPAGEHLYLPARGVMALTQGTYEYHASRPMQHVGDHDTWPAVQRSDGTWLELGPRTTFLVTGRDVLPIVLIEETSEILIDKPKLVRF